MAERLFKKGQGVLPEKITVSLAIDPAPILSAVKSAGDLGKRNTTLFGNLAAVAEARGKVEGALELVETLEREVKRAINDRAKALYGKDWTAIEGPGYKITRSFTGSVYDVVAPDKVDPKLVNITVRADTKAIDDYVETKDTLPAGIERNPNRAESIRIKVKK